MQGTHFLLMMLSAFSFVLQLFKKYIEIHLLPTFPERQRIEVAVVILSESEVVRMKKVPA